MGMDSYIFKTTKNEYRAYTKWKKEYAKHDKICNDFVEGLKTKYGTDLFEKERDEVKAIITPDEWSRALELANATHGEYDNCSGDEPIELAYWRKPYGLHQFIVGNFHKEKENNCVRIPLSKKAVRIILKEMRKCKNNYSDKSDKCIFGYDDYWDYDDLKRAIDFFKKLLENEFSKDSIIYYYTWY